MNKNIQDILAEQKKLQGISTKPFEALKELTGKESSAGEGKERLKTQLLKVKTYLEQYKQFLKIQEENQEVSKECSKAALFHFSMAKHLEKQIALDFKEGRFVNIGLQNKIDLFVHHLKKFKETSEESRVHQEARKLMDKKIQRLQKAYPEQSMAEIAAREILPPSKFSHATLAQIEATYFVLCREEAKWRWNGKTFKIGEELLQLKEALIKRDGELLQETLNNIREKIVQPHIVSPDVSVPLPYKYVNIKGVGEPNSLVLMLVNETGLSLSTPTDEKGNFVFENTELQFGINQIMFLDERYFFTDEDIQTYSISVAERYPFTGLHDPATQKAFANEEVNEIVRCMTCHNFMYDFSAIDNERTCTIPNCNGKDFWRVYETEFWKS